MNKKELANRILKNLDDYVSINYNFEDTYLKAIMAGLEGVTVLEDTHVSNCQVTGREFEDGEIVYYAPIDNNIIGAESIGPHSSVEPRVYHKR